MTVAQPAIHSYNGTSQLRPHFGSPMGGFNREMVIFLRFLVYRICMQHWLDIGGPISAFKGGLLDGIRCVTSTSADVVFSCPPVCVRVCAS